MVAEVEKVTGAHKHAKKCKEDVRECAACQANIRMFGKLPLSVLSSVLEEKRLAPSFKGKDPKFYHHGGR